MSVLHSLKDTTLRITTLNGKPVVSYNVHGLCPDDGQLFSMWRWLSKWTYRQTSAVFFSLWIYI